MGEVVLGRKLGNRALLWGAVIGTLPDLDVILSPFLDTAGRLIHHRGASHSLLVALLASLALSPLLAAMWKKQDVSRKRAAWFVFLVWSTHVLLDCFTVYGTRAGWPFSEYRVGFNNLFIVDPFYTVPLLVGIVCIARFREPGDPRRSRTCWRCIGVSTFYVALSLGAKAWVSKAFDEDLARRGLEFRDRMEGPSPFNIVLWRSVVDFDHELWVGYRSVFDSRSTPIRWTVYPRGREAFDRFSGGSRELQTICDFSEGWWIAREQDGVLWIGDLRFEETRGWRWSENEVDRSPAFSWVYTPGAGTDRLRQFEADDHQPVETLRQLAMRAARGQEKWEATPRLVGVLRRPPEALHVVD